MPSTRDDKGVFEAVARARGTACSRLCIKYAGITLFANSGLRGSLSRVDVFQAGCIIWRQRGLAWALAVWLASTVLPPSVFARPAAPALRPAVTCCPSPVAAAASVCPCCRGKKCCCCNMMSHVSSGAGAVPFICRCRFRSAHDPAASTVAKLRLVLPKAERLASPTVGTFHGCSQVNDLETARRERLDHPPQLS